MYKDDVQYSQYPESIKKEFTVPNITVPDILAQTAANIPDHPALIYYEKKILYKELHSLSIRFASALQNAGVQKGDRAAIMLPNCPQYVIAYYGILNAGAIVTQVNPMLVERELLHILSDSQPETIVVYEDLYPLVKKVQQHTNIKTIVRVSFQPSSQTEDYSFEAFLQSGSHPFQPASIEPEHDIALLQYTGGTTGRSKGAMLTHRNLVANTMQSAEFFKHDIQYGKDRCLTVIPLFHVFGMTSGMNLSIFTGAANILLPRFQVEEVLQTIKKEQPTMFPGVPTMYIAIMNHPNAEEYNIDSIRVCNSGSAPMPVGIMEEFEKKTGAKILEGYGLSEASPVTHCNPAFAERKPGSIGIGVPMTRYKIVDVATGTREMPFGETGELIISGPQIMKGYWNMPDETAHTLKDGWLYTGDLAKMDEEGYVYILDRKKDMIIASGYNIYPRDIEEVLYHHPKIQEAAVIGVPDAYRGETVKAIIVQKANTNLTKEEVKEYCAKNLSAYKVPKIIEFRSELPKTNVGKILRRALREEEKANAVKINPLN
ncbi:long-chain-fatty-acid--CoA ligase [Heyndrickxia acidicola]|uniref:Long-chain fatty acid--CoA ligase n=1 Tax=Heyndrickxia acidicola TaxID=209389 RepID=A0ABU6MHB1_9BACI|nr:long-chain fatty acid--CoA ligase [Heyndrickxia acidicola]MED1204061.1 long-chain fatty acid--CoA ligase [Heyndrickxia acidicola]